MSRLKNLSRTAQAALSLAPLVIVLLLLEIGARVVCWQRFDAYGTHFSVMGNGRWIDHDLTVWGNRPRFLEHTLASQYNEFGMRVPIGQVAMPVKGDDDFWVFLLGGSAVAGMGSNQDGEWLKITGVGTHPIRDSIDGQLERLLQAEMPDRKVRVFNAAIASGTSLQSLLRYRELRNLGPDWVITMDGINDPPSLNPEEMTRDVIESAWKSHRFKRWPFREFRFLMRNSALCFLVGEYVYAKSGIIRTPVSSSRDLETYRKWLGQSGILGPVNPLGEGEPRATAAFFGHLNALQQELRADGVQHLLLIQPHLSLRDTTQLKSAERAVYNYYAKTGGRVHGFLSGLHTSAKGMGSIFPMSTPHEWEFEVFVDYCHFTAEANRRISEELSKAILSGGDYRPFSSSAS